MVAVVLAVMCGAWGCAVSARPTPPSLPDDVRSQLSTIGVSALRYPPDSKLQAATSGKGWGAVHGAGYGLAVGVVPGLAIASTVQGCGGAREAAIVCGSVILAGLGVAVAGGTIGALVGSVHGAITAESASRVRAAETELESAMVDLDVQATFRDSVLRAARDRSTLSFVAVDDPEPGPGGKPAGESASSTAGVDAVLEVRVSRIGLAGQGSVNPPMILVMTAPVRLVRAADNTELLAATFQYRSLSAYKFVEWALADSAAFREEVERGVRSLADDIVRLLFPPDATDSPPTEPPADESAQEAESLRSTTASPEEQARRHLSCPSACGERDPATR